MIMQPFKREFEGRNIPPSIKKHIFDKKYRVDEIGKSGSSVLCFDNMVLKIEKQSEEADNEMSMLKWLYGRLPVPEIIEFERNGGFNYLLMSRLEGEMSILMSPSCFCIFLKAVLLLMLFSPVCFSKAGIPSLTFSSCDVPV